MLHKYYVNGRSRRFNLQFGSKTADDGWSIPNICHDLREAISNAVNVNDELYSVLNGYKQYLYLQKSKNTKRYWKVVIAVWYIKRQYDRGFKPDAIIRITTDNLKRVVKDKRTDQYYEVLPLHVFDDPNIRMFY